MPRTPDPGFPLVDPDAPRSDAGLRLAERLLGGHCPPEDRVWLAPLLLDILPNTEGGRGELSEETEGHFGILSLAWHLSEGDRDTTFLILLATLSNCIHIPRIIARARDGESQVWAMPDSVGDRVVTEFRSHGVDFNRVLKNGWPKHLRDEWARDKGAGVHERYGEFFRLLIRTGAVDLPSILDVAALRELGRRGSWIPAGFSMSNVAVEWNDGVSWLDPHSLRVWVWFTGLDALRRFLPVFLSEPPETLPALAFAVAQTAATWVGRPGHHRHYEAFEEAGEQFAETMRPYFEHLDARHSNGPADPLLHEARLLFFRMAWDARSASSPEPLRRRMVQDSTEDLARFRKLFAAAREGDTPEARQFISQHSHFVQCSIVLARYGGLWRCLKALLLGLRAMGTRAVAMDLRYWDEFIQDQPPQPWCTLPATFVGLFHSYVGAEQKDDPDLSRLRAEFAQFLLEKLTDRWSDSERQAAEAAATVRVDDDMKEPQWQWRYCIVRAVMDLRINPEGRGHNTLLWSTHHDPNPRVREIAARGHEQVRHTRGLPAGTSPRRAVLSAFWWYRQAHLLGLGLQPDSDAAQRTRAKELTRTKEVERGDTPAAG